MTEQIAADIARSLHNIDFSLGVIGWALILMLLFKRMR